MPLEKFEIRLDNPHKSYFAGQNVTGMVVLGLNGKSKLIHGMGIKLEKIKRGFLMKIGS